MSGETKYAAKFDSEASQEITNSASGEEDSTQVKAAFTRARTWWAPTLTILAAVLVVGGPFAYKFLAEQEEPNPVLMRQHIVSRLSEEEIRDIYAKSQELFEGIKATTEAEASERWAKWADNQSKCRDIAFRTKNPHACGGLPMFLHEIDQLPLGFSSVDEVFERQLLGICAYVSTIREAKKFKCLPE